MNLQSMSKLGFFLTFGAYIVLFAASVIIGAVGPTVIHNFPAQTVLHKNLDKNNTVPVSNLSKLNQQLILEVDVRYNGPTNGQIEVVFQLSVYARENNKSSWKTLQDGKQYQRSIGCRIVDSQCDSVWLAHEPFIGFSDYNFTISIINGSRNPLIDDMSIIIRVINHRFTLFELWFRFTFLLFTFAVIIVYAFRLRGFKWNDWTIEQKWVAVLLFGLLGYNNPCFPLEILINNWFPVFLDQVLLVSFLVLVLLFWLIMFDGLWKEPSQRTVLKFYAPKLGLLGLFWFAALVAFTWTELHQLDDVGTRVYEIKGYVFFKVFSLILILVYVFWLLYAVIRACNTTRSMPYLGLRLKFFGIFTLFIILITAGGILFGFIGPVANNAAEFLSFLSNFNLYIYTLAFVYLPSKSAYYGRKLEIGMIKLEEDDEDNDAFQPDRNDSDMMKIEFSTKGEADDDTSVELKELKTNDENGESDEDSDEHVKLEDP